MPGCRSRCIWRLHRLSLRRLNCAHYRKQRNTAVFTGYILDRTTYGFLAAVAFVSVPVFAFSFACILLGQTALIVFLLIALSWRLLELRRDKSAGVALALLTIKPQLTAVLLAA